jgi:hypothetical protein
MLNKKKPKRAGLGRTQDTAMRYDVQLHSTPIYAGGKVVGKVEGITFHKSLKASRHFLKIPPAIAFDASTLEDAEKAGAVKVQVTDQETGTIYKTTIAQIRDYGFRVNRGFGDQIALPLPSFICIKRGDGVQLSLFAEGAL